MIAKSVNFLMRQGVFLKSIPLGTVEKSNDGSSKKWPLQLKVWPPNILLERSRTGMCHVQRGDSHPKRVPPMAGSETNALKLGLALRERTVGGSEFGRTLWGLRTCERRNSVGRSGDREPANLRTANQRTAVFGLRPSSILDRVGFPFPTSKVGPKNFKSLSGYPANSHRSAYYRDRRPLLQAFDLQ